MQTANTIQVGWPTQGESECQWRGELGQLQQHVNGCDYVEVDCTCKCEGRSLRSIPEAELEICPKRPDEAKCTSTSSVIKQLETVFTENQLLREEIETIRKELDCAKKDHQNDAVQLKQELQNLKEEVAQLKEAHQLQTDAKTTVKSEAGKQEGSELVEKVGSVLAANISVKPETDLLRHVFDLEQKVNDISECCPVPPFYFTLFNFEHYRKEKLLWYSEPFYSQIGGYKMRAEVHAGGVHTGKGTHISVHVALMRGKNDPHLRWPFRGKVTVQVFCCKAWSHENTIVIDHSVDDACANRPLADSIGNPSWGVYKFVSLDSLDLESDCVRFRVLRVELL